MKKYICFLLVFSFLFVLLSFPASAASIPPDPPGLALPLGKDLAPDNTFVNSIGDVSSHIFVHEMFYFQLWGDRAGGQWLDYLGEYYNESRVFQSPELNGRIRPFGNTDLNIGGVASQLRTGYYFPFDRIPRAGTISFDFGFKLQDVSTSGNMLPPLDGLYGYFYLFLLKDDFTVDRIGWPITYQYSYNESQYVATYKCVKDVDLGKIGVPDNGVDYIGFVPLYTFHDLVTDSMESMIYFPLFQFSIESTYQQQMVFELQNLFNGTLNPTNWDPDDFIGSTDRIVSSLDQFASDNITGDIKESFSSASNVLRVFNVGVITVSKLFSYFAGIDFINDVLIVSMSLGVIASLFSIGISIKGRVSADARDKERAESRKHK